MNRIGELHESQSAMTPLVTKSTAVLYRPRHIPPHMPRSPHGPPAHGVDPAGRSQASAVMLTAGPRHCRTIPTRENDRVWRESSPAAGQFFSTR